MGFRIPSGRRRTSWLFTGVVMDVNSVLPRTNAAGGQSGASELQVQRFDHTATLPSPISEPVQGLLLYFPFRAAPRQGPAV